MNTFLLGEHLRRRCIVELLICAWIVCAVSICSAAGLAGDEQWDGRFYPASFFSTEERIYTIAVTDDGMLYAGGSFTAISGTLAPYIARWNGEAWAAVGDRFSGKQVNAIAQQGQSVYAGGIFTKVGSRAVSNLARWDGASWNDVGGGVNGRVTALLAEGTNLYVGGTFTLAGAIAATNVARWDGISWSPLGRGIAGQVVGQIQIKAFAVIGDQLYVGGVFSQIDGLTVNHIARWDGTNWHSLGSGMTGAPPQSPKVQALLVKDGHLFAGGAFENASGIAATNIAEWDGQQWHGLGLGYVSPGYLNEMNALASVGNDLYAGGSFLMAGGKSAVGLVKWDGTNWVAVPGNLTSAIALAANASQFYAAGSISDIVAGVPSGIARFDGESFHPLGLGFDSQPSRVNSLCASELGVVAGGKFKANGLPADQLKANIARWNASDWEGLGTGFLFTLSEVFSVAAQGADVYAAGLFSRVGLVPAVRIAHWDGTNWNAMGEGLTFAARALAVRGQTVYAGGNGGLAQWNGRQWCAVGLGLPGDIRALAMDDEALFVGGACANSNGLPGGFVAKWDGAAWTDLGSNFDGTVLTLAAGRNQLYAGGIFTNYGSIRLNGIARWTGGQWSSVGGGVSRASYSRVMALALSSSGSLFAGGYFDRAGAVSATNVAVWSKDSWSGLGSGLNILFGAPNIVNSMVYSGRELFLGGPFDQAGGKASSRFAIWHDTEPILGVQGYAVPSVRSGDSLEYRLLVANYGADDLTAVILRMPLPTGTSLISANAGGVLTNGEVVWRYERLTAGQAPQAFSASVLVTGDSRTLVNRDYSVSAEGLLPAQGYPVYTTVIGPNQAPAITWVSPADGAAFAAPANILLEVQASVPAGTLERVDFYCGTNRIGTVTNTPYLLTWSNVAAGSYAFQAAAYNHQQGSTLTLPVLISVIQRPPNDNFANRILLTDAPVTVEGTTVNATSEIGEPKHSNYGGPNCSVWWSWTAPTDGVVQLWAIPQAANLMASIYTGTSLTGLTLVASANYVYGSSITPSVAGFVARAGTTYQVAIDQNANDATGSFSLKLDFGPLSPNDNFTNRTLLDGYSVTAFGNTIGATREPPEPAHLGINSAHSLWWSWVAPDSGMAHISSAGSQSTTLVAVYTGSALDRLQWIGSNDTIKHTVVTVQAGRAYQIALDAYEAPGPIQLNIDLIPRGGRFTSPPSNLTQPWSLLLKGFAGLTYEIESSTNLVDWDPAGTLLISDWTNAFLAPLDLDQRQRFYRAKTRTP